MSCFPLVIAMLCSNAPGANLPSTEQYADTQTPQHFMRPAAVDRDRPGARPHFTSIKDSPEKNSKTESKTESSSTKSARDRLKFRPSITLSGGYDSNYDEDADEIGSGFQRYDAKLGVEYDGKGRSEFELNLTGQILDLPELEESFRWQYEIEFNALLELSKTADFRFGFTHDQDNTIPPAVITNESFAEFRNDGERADIRLRGSVEHVINLSSGEDFGGEEPEDFNYVKSIGSAYARLKTSDTISPYAEFRGGYVSYPDQRPDLTGVSRNAADFVVRAGLRLRPSKKFKMDLGGRYNLRSYSSFAPISSTSNGFVDLDATWRPTGKLRIRGRIRRQLDETNTDQALVDDETNYRLSVKQEFSKKFDAEASASYTKKIKVGRGQVDREQEYELVLNYRPLKNWRFFSELIYAREDERPDFEDTWERFVFRVGGNIKLD